MSYSLWPHGLYAPYSPILHYLPDFAQIHVHWVSDAIYLIPFSSHLQSFSASVFRNEFVLHIRWPKYWGFNFSISPSNDCSGLISLRIDWFNLLAGQGTLKSLLQHHSLKVSILQHSTFPMVQIFHPNVTTGKKNLSLTIWTFFAK